VILSKLAIITLLYRYPAVAETLRNNNIITMILFFLKIVKGLGRQQRNEKKCVRSSSFVRFVQSVDSCADSYRYMGKNTQIRQETAYAGAVLDFAYK
jgi:hypothetical protein